MSWKISINHAGLSISNGKLTYCDLIIYLDTYTTKCLPESFDLTLFIETMDVELSVVGTFVVEALGKLKGYASLFGKSQHWNLAPFKAVDESPIRTLIPHIAMLLLQLLVSPHVPL